MKEGKKASLRDLLPEIGYLPSEYKCLEGSGSFMALNFVTFLIVIHLVPISDQQLKACIAYLSFLFSMTLFKDHLLLIFNNNNL